MEAYQLRMLYENRDTSNTHLKTHDTVYADTLLGLSDSDSRSKFRSDE